MKPPCEAVRKKGAKDGEIASKGFAAEAHLKKKNHPFSA
jgi:hypothetical protein